jgi:flagellar motor switch/type III secretory pathway protein FliN
MATFDREIIESVHAACQAGKAEATEALRRAFGGEMELEIGEAAGFAPDGFPPECRGPGLVLVLRVGTEAALLVLAESSPVLPAWCHQLDDAARTKVTALAVELGSLLLPETHAATAGAAGYVEDLEGALRQAGISAHAARVPLLIRGVSGSGLMSLIWPVSQPEAVFQDRPDAQPSQRSESNVFQGVHPDRQTAQQLETLWDSGPPIGGSAADLSSKTADKPRRKVNCEEVEDGIPQLPPYSRSLLKIQVPVMVTLAEAKQPIANVLDMGPGSIIHFNKPCEDTLALEIAGQKVALGEAVKVGDKFGLWLTSMILPEERFWVISNRARTERAK